MHRSSGNSVPTRHLAILLLASSLSGVAGCNGDEQAGEVRAGHRGATGEDAALPAPEGAIGSVTGMPEGPGPGTSPITPVTPVQSGATADTVGDVTTSASYEGLDGSSGAPMVDGQSPLPEPDIRHPLEQADPLADAPPIIIVPDLPDTPVATRPVERTQAPPPPGTPIGTERATESTTIVVESDDATGD